MATILLQAAGALIGGVLGPVGAAVGSAAGAMIGYTLDRAVIGSLRHDKGPRLSGTRPFAAEDGAPLPRLYGTMRVGGTMIWATRFEEDSQTRRGGKGGPRTTTYSYFANVAFALCEGEIAGVRRVWADGRELDLDGIEMRVHRGTGNQAPDPLILAKQGEGNAPAYRGTAYVVFERLPLDTFGNRVPQFQFEVMRPVGRLAKQICAVTLLPGSTEYGLMPEPVSRLLSPGESVSANRHVFHAGSDLLAALNELQALCPNLEHVGLVVTWFGDDLRAGTCTIRPKVVQSDSDGFSRPWQVAGVSRAAALEVSTVGGQPAYGGSPSDESIVKAIRELRERDIKVTLYPFMMMDIASDNELPDPYGAVRQPAYPWRGRLNCDPAPQRPGTADKTAAARAQIALFCGSAEAEDFTVTEDHVAYHGDAEDWGYRRFVLHHAALAAAAGGIDAILLGSEMRGLTTLRDGAGAFPFVEELCSLAEEARAIVGDETKITYAADWSEYFGHQPADGSGDVLFHLDAFWAHEDVDAVAIDCYFPLADWRDEDYAAANPDGANGPYDLDALRHAIGAGEGFDWYYASTAARAARARLPIEDGTYGKPWVYRYKDIKSWWSNLHYDRPGGVEASGPTAWVPQSKPIWLTEIGAPAVDKGPNQPNVFPDAKSVEDSVPHHSNGGRSDTAQYNLLMAHLDHWTPGSPHFQSVENPVSAVYGGRMVDPVRVFCWTWDARPFPAYPTRSDVWRDGDNWLRGHWLNGRLCGVELRDLLDVFLAENGIAGVSLAGISGSLNGFLVAEPMTTREALDPLITLFGLVASTDDGVLAIQAPHMPTQTPLVLDRLAFMGDTLLRRSRQSQADLPDEAILAFSETLRSYQSATVRGLAPEGGQGNQETFSLAAAMDGEQAQALLADWMRRVWSARETVEFAVDHTRIDVAPGCVVDLTPHGLSGHYIVTGIDSGELRTVTARRIAALAPAAWRPRLPAPVLTGSTQAGPPLVVPLDLPMLAPGDTEARQFRLAVRSEPWRSQQVLASPEETGYEPRTVISTGATIGVLSAPIASGFEGRLDRAGTIEVQLISGALSSISHAQLLRGGNLAAVLASNGEWEILQFSEADEIGPSLWQLRGLLRGEAGSEAAMLAGSAAGSHFVLLDSAVVPAGLGPTEIGLSLNWLVGPSGAPLGGAGFSSFSTTGGTRASRPLPPVHLNAHRTADGSLNLTWLARSRVASMRGIAAAQPLGEAAEAYRVEIGPPGAPPLRTFETHSRSCVVPAHLLASDFATRPAPVELRVTQLGSRPGPGDPAKLIHELH